MKIFALTLLFATSVSFASDHAVEYGTYRAVDIETGTIVAILDARPDMTAHFTVKTPDFEMPAPGCEGSYSITGDILQADMKCPMEGLEQIKVKIDIKNVTPASVRIEQGADVDVMIDALGADSFKFRLKKMK